MKYHGYYSAHQDKRYGHCIYKDSDGNNIKITEVIDATKKPITKWNDLVFVGEVTDFVSSTVKMDSFLDFKTPQDEILKLKELYNKACEVLEIQKKCQGQFKQTNKCFCYTCPVKNVN